jgi:hypothetical protein
MERQQLQVSRKRKCFGVLKSITDSIVSIVTPHVTNAMSSIMYCLPHLASDAVVESSNLDSYPDYCDVKHMVPAATESLPQPQSCSHCCTLALTASSLCRYCGYSDHIRKFCPAKQNYCSYCDSRGHFTEVCQKRDQQYDSTSTDDAHNMFSAPSSPTGLRKTIVPIIVNNCHDLEGLIDSGSTDSFIDSNVASNLKLTVRPSYKSINLASSTSVHTEGVVTVSLKIKDNLYNDFDLHILPHLCCPVIIGNDLFSQHSKLIICFNGPRGDLKVPDHKSNPKEASHCNLTEAMVQLPSLFRNLSQDCHPIKCPSRNYTPPDREFISNEIARMLKAGIIEGLGLVKQFRKTQIGS